MGMLSASSARFYVTLYAGKIENAEDEVIKNFNDMDLENCNRRDEIEDFIEEIQRDCEDVRTELLNLYFEE
jgi:hypothetical protein